MPAPDPNGLTYDETATGAPIVRAEIWGRRNRPFFEGNAKHRIARAKAVLSRLRFDGWACRACKEPIPMYRRADARYCCEGCRKRAARERRGYYLRDTRAYGMGFNRMRLTEAQEAHIEAQLAAMRERQAQRRRVTCGAKTRKGGQCRNKSEAGRARCKFHGGRSTGPKTPEGKASIAEAQRARWAAWRNTKIALDSHS